jgi:hypothetical protein
VEVWLVSHPAYYLNRSLLIFSSVKNKYTKHFFGWLYPGVLLLWSTELGERKGPGACCEVRTKVDMLLILPQMPSASLPSDTKEEMFHGKYEKQHQTCGLPDIRVKM